MDKGPLFSIKNSSVVFVFSFLKALPASLKDEQEVKRINKNIKINTINNEIDIKDLKI